MSTIGSLGSYAAQLWHTRANPNNQEQFKAQIEEQTASVSAAAAAKASDASATVDTSNYDDEAFAKLKLALDNMAGSGSESDSGDSAVSDSGKTTKTASEQFHEWMNMTPGEKLRASILEELGISEEDLANMSPEARENVEAGIAEKVQTLFAKQAEENQRNYRSDHGDSEKELINVSV